MKKLILVVMMLVFTGQAWGAAEWEELGKTENFTSYIDNSSFEVGSENSAEFWLKNVYTRNGAKKVFPKSKKPVSHTMEKYSVNCGGNKTLVTIEFYVYSKNNIIFSDKSYNSNPLIPGSINQSIHELACGRVQYSISGNAKADEAQ